MKSFYEVSKEADFSAAHLLRDYNGPCENLHGHNWKVRVSVASTQLNEQGMVVDFGLMNTLLKQLIASLDHQLINEIAPFDKTNPTSENIARFIHEGMQKELYLAHNQPKDFNLWVRSVEVWETDRSRAAYYFEP